MDINILEHYLVIENMCNIFTQKSKCVISVPCIIVSHHMLR